MPRRYDQLKLGVWIGVGWVMFPIWGLVLPAAIATQVDIAKELEDLMQQSKFASKEASEVQNLIGTTATMEKQFSLLLEGMEKALAALKELQTMFDSQASSFDAAATSCTDALGALDTSWRTRKEWLEEWADTTTEEWEHVSEKIPQGDCAKQVTADCRSYPKVHGLQRHNNCPGLKKMVTFNNLIYIITSFPAFPSTYQWYYITKLNRSTTVYGS